MEEDLEDNIPSALPLESVDAFAQEFSHEDISAQQTTSKDGEPSAYYAEVESTDL